MSAMRVVAAGACAAGVALALASPAPISLNRDQFVLITTEGEFALQFDSRGKKKRITAFAMGNGKLGLHLSSFDLLQEGSAQAAAGRDVFLVFDPNASTVQRGLTGLGITKHRVREDGCFNARTAHFLLADIDQDGITDIGVVTELIECRTAQPVYSQHPAQWYVFRDGQWRMNPAYGGVLPRDSAALPLIGMDLSPVDFVAYGYWKSHDPSMWRSKNLEMAPYQPPYRSTLVRSSR